MRCEPTEDGIDLDECQFDVELPDLQSIVAIAVNERLKEAFQQAPPELQFALDGRCKRPLLLTLGLPLGKLDDFAYWTVSLDDVIGGLLHELTEEMSDFGTSKEPDEIEVKKSLKTARALSASLRKEADKVDAWCERLEKK